jgi:hypothetical protein
MIYRFQLIGVALLPSVHGSRESSIDENDDPWVRLEDIADGTATSFTDLTPTKIGDDASNLNQALRGRDARPGSPTGHSNTSAVVRTSPRSPLSPPNTPLESGPPESSSLMSYQGLPLDQEATLAFELSKSFPSTVSNPDA